MNKNSFSFEDLLNICEQYKNLGWAVQDQLKSILDDSSLISEQNPNALRMIKTFLVDVAALDENSDFGGTATSTAEEIEEFLEEAESEEA